VNGKHCLQQAVWHDSGINTLTVRQLIQSFYPAASVSLPLPRQAAGTLQAMQEERTDFQKIHGKNCWYNYERGVINLTEFDNCTCNSAHAFLIKLFNQKRWERCY